MKMCGCWERMHSGRGPSAPGRGPGSLGTRWGTSYVQVLPLRRQPNPDAEKEKVALTGMRPRFQNLNQPVFLLLYWWGSGEER